MTSSSHAELALAVIFVANLIAAGVLVWLAISGNPPGQRGWGSWWPPDDGESDPPPEPPAPPRDFIAAPRKRSREGLDVGDLTPPRTRRRSHPRSPQPTRERRRH